MKKTFFISKLNCDDLFNILNMENDLKFLYKVRDNLYKLTVKEYSDKIDIPKEYPEKITINLKKSIIIIDSGRNGVNRLIDRLNDRINKIEN